MAVDINKPQTDTDNNRGFGLPKGEFRPIEPTENRKWLRTTLIIAGVVLLIGAGIVIWLFKSPSNPRDLITKNLQKNQEEADRLREEQLTENEKNLSSNEADLLELKEFSEEFTEPKHQQEAQQESPIMVINAPTGLYYVIISSYIDIDLAMDYAKKLNKQGIHSKIITPASDKHFVRLSIAQAATWKEAKQKADELKTTYGNQVWVMKY